MLEGGGGKVGIAVKKIKKQKRAFDFVFPAFNI